MVIQHNVINDCKEVGGFLLVLRSTLHDLHDITEILLKVASNTKNLNPLMLFENTILIDNKYVK